jgi:hypothetical protein
MEQGVGGLIAGHIKPMTAVDYTVVLTAVDYTVVLTAVDYTVVLTAIDYTVVLRGLLWPELDIDRHVITSSVVICQCVLRSLQYLRNSLKVVSCSLKRRRGVSSF